MLDNLLQYIQFLKFYHGKNKWITNKINQIKDYEKYKFIFSTYSYNGDFSTTFLNSLFKEKSSNFLNGFTPNPESPRDSINVAWQLKRTNNLEYDRIKNKFSESLFSSYQ